MKLTLRTMMIAMGLVSLLAALALGGLAIYAAQSASQRLNQVYQGAVTPMALLDAISADVKEVRFRMAGVLLQQLPTVGSANHLKEMQKALPARWQEFYEKAHPQTLPKEQRKQVETIAKGMKALDGLMAKLLVAYNGDDMKTIQGILEDEWPSIHSHVIKPLEHLLPYYQKSAQSSYDRASSEAAHLTNGVVLLLIVVAVLLVGSSIYLTRRLLGQIHRAQSAISAFAKFDLTQDIAIHGNDEVARLLADLAAMRGHLRDMVGHIRDDARTLADMSQKMATASRTVASASTNQSESATGMAASVEQLSVSVDQVKDHALASHDQAKRSSEASTEGKRVIARAAAEMAAIAESVRQSSDAVSQLGTLSSEISGIIGVINEIAEQTNLLALNAAIEAARAGEQGRGFAVVADEVRKLAERTAASTLQIGDMVTNIQEGTQRAVEIMASEVSRANDGEALAKQAGDSIGEIETGVRELVGAVNEIHAAISEQSTAAREVAAQVERIATMAESNSSASHETSETADGVFHMANNLNELVAGFKI